MLYKGKNIFVHMSVLCDTLGNGDVQIFITDRLENSFCFKVFFSILLLNIVVIENNSSYNGLSSNFSIFCFKIFCFKSDLISYNFLPACILLKSENNEMWLAVNPLNMADTEKNRTQIHTILKSFLLI